MTDVITGGRDDEIAEFLVNEGFHHDTLPILCVLSGSRAYGLDIEESDRDYVAVHMMNTWECLEHPDFRQNLQVIRKRFDNDLEELEPGKPGGSTSLDSFELWKFTSLLLKGAFVVHELLYLPSVVHQSIGADTLFDICREGMSAKISRVAKGNVMHDWGKNRRNRKKTVMAYYRLLQAIFMLREEEFEANATALFEYATPAGLVQEGNLIKSVYMNPEARTTQLNDKEAAGAAKELERLIDEVGKAAIATRLPDQFPRKNLEKILQVIKTSRGNFI
jgi:predicted nucleotidyltransferase